jgi:hypothetical protein
MLVVNILFSLMIHIRAESSGYILNVQNTLSMSNNTKTVREYMISQGKHHGLKSGQKYAVIRNFFIKDPFRWDQSRVEKVPVGIVKITEVFEGFSMATEVPLRSGPSKMISDMFIIQGDSIELIAHK